MPRACYRLPPEKHPASHRESIAKLAVIQLRIEPILCHQGFMAALLNDMSVLHDKDHIRFPDGREPVRHDKAGPPLHHAGKGRLNLDFRPGVDAAGSLIQNQHRGKAEDHAGNAEKLLLALTDIAAVFRDDRVIALGHAADKAMGMSGLCRRDDFLVSSA